MPSSAAGTGLPNRQQRTIPFSTHARGVPLFERTRFFDLPRHAARILLDLRDISSALFWFISCQTWLSLWSSIITLISVTFFSYYSYRGGRLAAQLDWVLISSVAVIPAVGFLWVAYQRRERALDELAKVKVLMIGIFAAHRDWAPDACRPEGHLEAVQDALATVVDAMRAYFSPMRFYTRYYPYLGFRAAMIHIALERTRQMRRIASSIETLEAAIVALHGTTVSPALLAQLHDRTLQLQLSIQCMANIKEFRTPQGVRSLSRFYLILFLPVFFGPYWAWVSVETNFGFAFFFSILMQLAVTGMVNTTIALEDPFDNNGMDGVFLDEALYEVEQAVLPGAEGQHGGSNEAAEEPAAPPGGGSGGGNVRASAQAGSRGAERRSFGGGLAAVSASAGLGGASTSPFATVSSKPGAAPTSKSAPVVTDTV